MHRQDSRLRMTKAANLPGWTQAPREPSACRVLAIKMPAIGRNNEADTTAERGDPAPRQPAS